MNGEDLKVLENSTCITYKLNDMIATITKKIEWIFDYYFVYFLYNARKIDKYNDYMKKKYGPKFSGRK